MPKPVVVLVALFCFATPVLMTVVGYSIPSIEESSSETRPSQLPGKVLFFSASWCGACQRAQPTYLELRNAGYPISKVDVDSNQSLAQKYGIRSIPQFVYVKNGKEIRRVSGAASAGRVKRLYRGGW